MDTSSVLELSFYLQYFHARFMHLYSTIQWMKGWLNERKKNWMNEGEKERSNEQMGEGSNVNARKNEEMKDRMNEWINDLNEG